MIYIVVFFLMFFCVYAYDYRKHTRFYDVSYWGFFLILVLIAGLRYRIGTDSIAYENVYEEMPTLLELASFKYDSIRYEPGYVIFASIPRSISSDFTLFQIFHAFVVNLVIFWFIKSNTKHRFLALSFYFIVLYLNLNTQVLREALAVSVFLLAWPFLRDGRWGWYYCLSVLATSFHTSAFFILLLPLACLPGIRQCFKLGWRTLFICVVLFAIGFVVQSKFQDFFTFLSVTERMSDRANLYANTKDGGTVLNPVGALFLFLQYCLYPLVALFFMRFKIKQTGDKESQRHFERWQILVMTGIYFSILSIPIFIMGRYFNYFGMFQLVLVASWISTRMYYKNKIFKLKPVYLLILVLAFYALFFKAYFSPANKSGTLKGYMIYMPYKSRLNPEMDVNREEIYRYYNVK